MPRDARSPWPERDRFDLTGPSQPLDPARFAIRRDLADIQLADRVFAPHYARALATRAEASTPIRSQPDADGSIVGELAPGATFRVLEIGRAFAWGQVGDDGPIGYVDRHALVADGA